MLVLLLLLFGAATANQNCGTEELLVCMSHADVLLHDPDYIFPTSNDLIYQSCSTWDAFIRCLRRYLDRCFHDAQKLEWFKSMVKEPFETVNDMCTNSKTTFKTDYLEHAGCLRNVTTQTEHCGTTFSHLVEAVTKTKSSLPDTQICCSHHKFRSCLLEEVRYFCDRDFATRATTFAKDILDRSLGFIIETCKDYTPNDYDCPEISAMPARNNRILEASSSNRNHLLKTTPTRTSAATQIQPTTSRTSTTTTTTSMKTTETTRKVKDRMTVPPGWETITTNAWKPVAPTWSTDPPPPEQETVPWRETTRTKFSEFSPRPTRPWRASAVLPRSQELHGGASSTSQHFHLLVLTLNIFLVGLAGLR